MSVNNNSFQTLRDNTTNAVHSMYFVPSIKTLPTIALLVIDEDSKAQGSIMYIKPKRLCPNSNIYILTITNAYYMTVHRLQGRTIMSNKQIYVNIDLFKSYVKKINKKRIVCEGDADDGQKQYSKYEKPTHMRNLYVLLSRLQLFCNIKVINKKIDK